MSCILYRYPYKLGDWIQCTTTHKGIQTYQVQEVTRRHPRYQQCPDTNCHFKLAEKSDLINFKPNFYVLKMVYSYGLSGITHELRLYTDRGTFLGYVNKTRPRGQDSVRKIQESIGKVAAFLRPLSKEEGRFLHPHFPDEIVSLIRSY